MSANIIYSGGTAKVTIPSGESIAVYTSGKSLVYREIGYPNVPSTKSLLAELSNAHQVFGSYSSGATIIIEAGDAGALYEVGTSPLVQEKYGRTFGLKNAPSAMTTTATMTVAQLMNGLITGTHTAGATQTYTLPTGALLDAASEFATGEGFEWVLINLSAAAADTVTIAAGTGHTVVGSMVVASAHSTTGALYGNAARFLTRKTAADTFVTYRIS